MATETPSVAPPRAEVPMGDAEVVPQIREPHRGGWGAEGIAREPQGARHPRRRQRPPRTAEAATERVVQKVVAPRGREVRALQLATVRYETAPGHQMQVDFGQKRVRIGERTVVVHLLVAVLSYSRRIFVKAFLAERGDDWREGI